jgi:hypothetical protein
VWRAEDPDLLIDSSGVRAASDDDLRAWLNDQRVFISSVMAEFAQERAALASVVRDRGAVAVLFEQFGGRDADPEAAYLEEVRSSQIYVGLLGRRYGRLAVNGFSATHEEFLEAERAGLRITAWASEVSDREGHERSLLDEIQRFHTTGIFASTDELVGGVVTRLARLGPLNCRLESSSALPSSAQGTFDGLAG